MDSLPAVSSPKNLAIESICCDGMNLVDELVDTWTPSNPPTMGRRQFLLGTIAVTGGLALGVTSIRPSSAATVEPASFGLGKSSGDRALLNGPSLNISAFGLNSNEIITPDSFVNYSAEGIDQSVVYEIADKFERIRTGYGYPSLSALTKEQQYMVAFYTALTHSESTLAVMPDSQLTPQRVTADLIARRTNLESNRLFDVLNPIMPQSGNVFTALKGLNPTNVYQYIGGKGDQLAKTGYAAKIMHYHEQVALEELLGHKEIGNNRFIFQHFHPKKIFDPENDAASATSFQLAWINQNPQSRALQFMKYNDVPWYIVGERLATIDSDPLSAYDVSLDNVIRDLKRM